MNKILLLFLSIGFIFLIGCTAVTQSSGIATNEIDDTKDLTVNEGITSKNDEFEIESSVAKKIKSNPDLEDEIKTLGDGTKYLLHPDNILSGGPPKDGIPSIDNPKFDSVEEANKWLKDDDLVLGLDYNGAVRVYPHRILNWHEIVNDFAGNERVLITYCPLCRTGIAFKPVVNGQEVEFGTSGKLYNSELVMYDRLTDSYWPQTLGIAVVGPATGQILEKIPLDTVRWSDWKRVYPDTLVLSRQTGFIRDYDSSPYSGIQNSDRIGFGVEFKDKRLRPKVIVFGVEFDGKAKAYAEDDVKSLRLINDVVGNVPIVLVWDNELNTVKIFERTLNNDILTFELKNNLIIDSNNNEWTMKDMTDKLETVDTFGHFWFAWAAFFPETELFEV